MIVIVVLGECKDDEPASTILSVLEKLVITIPKVKFLIAGRPEPAYCYMVSEQRIQTMDNNVNTVLVSVYK